MVTLMTTWNNTDIATIIKNIKHCEEIKHSFKILRSISKGAQGGWTSIANKDEVSARLLLCNKLHLHQAWDTSCAHGPLKNNIGEYGIGSGTNNILDGNFDPNIAGSLPDINY
eukprot:11388126-Ditylum_brightwellii.AAC.1